MEHRLKRNFMLSYRLGGFKKKLKLRSSKHTNSKFLSRCNNKDNISPLNVLKDESKYIFPPKDTIIELENKSNLSFDCEEIGIIKDECRLVEDGDPVIDIDENAVKSLNTKFKDENNLEDKSIDKVQEELYNSKDIAGDNDNSIIQNLPLVLSEPILNQTIPEIESSKSCSTEIETEVKDAVSKDDIEQALKPYKDDKMPVSEINCSVTDNKTLDQSKIAYQSSFLNQSIETLMDEQASVTGNDKIALNNSSDKSFGSISDKFSVEICIDQISTADQGVINNVTEYDFGNLKQVQKQVDTLDSNLSDKIKIEPQSLLFKTEVLSITDENLKANSSVLGEKICSEFTSRIDDLNSQNLSKILDHNSYLETLSSSFLNEDLHIKKPKYNHDCLNESREQPLNYQNDRNSVLTSITCDNNLNNVSYPNYSHTNPYISQLENTKHEEHTENLIISDVKILSDTVRNIEQDIENTSKIYLNINEQQINNFDDSLRHISNQANNSEINCNEKAEVLVDQESQQPTVIDSSQVGYNSETNLNEKVEVLIDRENQQLNVINLIEVSNNSEINLNEKVEVPINQENHQPAVIDLSENDINLKVIASSNNYNFDSNSNLVVIKIDSNEMLQSNVENTFDNNVDTEDKHLNEAGSSNTFINDIKNNKQKAQIGGLFNENMDIASIPCKALDENLSLSNDKNEKVMSKTEINSSTSIAFDNFKDLEVNSYSTNNLIDENKENTLNTLQETNVNCQSSTFSDKNISSNNIPVQQEQKSLETSIDSICNSPIHKISLDNQGTTFDHLDCVKKIKNQSECLKIVVETISENLQSYKDCTDICNSIDIIQIKENYNLTINQLKADVIALKELIDMSELNKMSSEICNIISVIESVYDTYNNALISKDEEIDSLRKNIHMASIRSKILQENIDYLTKQNEKLRILHDDDITTILKLRSQIDSIREQVCELENIKAKAANDFIKIQEENHSNIAGYGRELKKIKSEVNGLKETVNALQVCNYSSELNDIISNIQSNCELEAQNLRNSIELLANENFELKQRNTELEESNNRLVDYNKELADELLIKQTYSSELEKSVDDLMKSRKFFEDQLINSDVIIKTLKESKQKMALDFSLEIEKLKKQFYKENGLLKLQIEELMCEKDVNKEN